MVNKTNMTLALKREENAHTYTQKDFKVYTTLSYKLTLL